MATDVGRVASPNRLSQQAAEPASGLVPTGFDPARVRDVAAAAYLMADAGAHAAWAINFLAETRDIEHWGDCTRVAMTCDRCCAEEALKAADEVLAAIAMEAASAGETEGLDGNRDSAGLKGIAQPSGLTKGDTDHDDR